MSPNYYIWTFLKAICVYNRLTFKGFCDTILSTNEHYKGDMNGKQF